MSGHVEQPVPGLPSRYADLERFCARWARPTFGERRAQRQAASIEELREFYHALQPRVEEVLGYLDRFPLRSMPAAERRLLNLCLALADVALSIEKYNAPGPPNTDAGAFATDTSALD
jgi:hypothetical protein